MEALKNICWLISDKIFSLISGMFVTIFVARYLGPEQMGVINFSMVLISFITPISIFGTDLLVYNRASINKLSALKVIKHTRIIRNFLFVICFILAIVYSCYFVKIGSDELEIVTLILISSYFSISDIYRFYFDAILKSKINSVLSQVSLLLTVLVRVVLVKFNLSIIFFTIPFIINAFIPYYIKSIIFKKEIKKNRCYLNVKNERYERKKYIQYALSYGSPLLISVLSMVIYTRIGQLILISETSMKDVAIYNAALTLGNSWLFIPLAIITSFLPKIMKDKNIKSQKSWFSFLYFLSLLTMIPVIFVFYFYGSFIIEITYGYKYIEASSVIFILVLSACFSIYGTISYRIIIIKGGGGYIMLKSVFMAIFNIVLSLLLIKPYGLIGCAYAILITEFLSSTIANYLFSNYLIFKLQFKALLFFIRYGDVWKIVKKML